MKRSLTSRPLSSTPVPVVIFHIVLLVTIAISSSAQTFNSLVSFNISNGAYPYGSSVVQGRDGNLYGTTSIGGANNGCGGHSGCGVFYKFNPTTNVLTTLYSFCALSSCADGANPQAGVVLGKDGNFYGSTSFGGSVTCNCGTIFRMTPAGVLTTLHVFSTTDGADPQGPLIQASDGNFYGTTYLGGASNVGTLFQVTPAGKLTTLHSFSGSDGSGPFTGVIQGTNGSLYGTTFSGGAGSVGTIFQMAPNKTFTTLHSFNFSDGVFPNGLVQATDGNLYGTASGGGTSTACNGGSCGTIYKLTLNGATVTTLYNFDDGLGGAQPSAGLIQATDNNLYGTTVYGGANHLSSCQGNLGCGIIFSIPTTGGAVTTLHSFAFTDGFGPGVLLQSTSGVLYGTTDSGGNSSNQCDCGTIFSLDTGLGPFVQALSYSGKVGTIVRFLGQGFTKATTVSFNGTVATPTGGSATFLTVKVPVGATTGYVTITTKNGSLKSNKIFRVLP